ncbi:hypothetical protein TNCV_4965211 [Trichonephila clavipes]|nr:hypothetical protein TNCV_4965211 [Trichonephila clavipes]
MPKGQSNQIVGSSSDAINRTLKAKAHLKELSFKVVLKVKKVDKSSSGFESCAIEEPSSSFVYILNIYIPLERVNSN